ncbi:hypothetical protein SIM91_05570 [Rhodococcus opacus]|uniref:hypothetical protein n=1 Tax=Rhodococcus opacus TaxID=37919 RepID=UPI0002A31849|nr:hypothetical protein [Rhodococcus opacus]ELB87115.1 hypothetical protein Rwratislav_41315 [Rhodococcus wratislaviensis IFP 2016]MDX5962784.1 hypothetical protein [Rhodococcus opacus]CAG7637898.1 hypothetical protein E143388_07942 [Rhodococcus opacus]
MRRAIVPSLALVAAGLITGCSASTPAADSSGTSQSASPAGGDLVDGIECRPLSLSTVTHIIGAAKPITPGGDTPSLIVDAAAAVATPERAPDGAKGSPFIAALSVHRAGNDDAREVVFVGITDPEGPASPFLLRATGPDGSSATADPADQERSKLSSEYLNLASVPYKPGTAEKALTCLNESPEN